MRSVLVLCARSSQLLFQSAALSSSSSFDPVDIANGSASCCTGSVLESAEDESYGEGGLGSSGGHGETEPICRWHRVVSRSSASAGVMSEDKPKGNDVSKRTPQAESAGDSQGSQHGVDKVLGLSILVIHVLDDEHGGGPERYPEAHLQTLLESAFGHVVVLALVVHEPAGGRGG